jgi:hypothetical protein
MSDCLLDPEHVERESLCGSNRHRPFPRPTLGPPRMDPFSGQRVGRYRSVLVRAYTFFGCTGAVRARRVWKRQMGRKLSFPPVRWLPGFLRGQSRYDQSQTRLPHAKSSLDRAIDLPWSKSQKITTGNLCLQQYESTRRTRTRTRTRTRIYSAPYSYSYLQRTVLTVLVLVLASTSHRTRTRIYSMSLLAVLVLVLVSTAHRTRTRIYSALQYGTEAFANNSEILFG